MDSDSIKNSSSPSAKDFSRKKRRSAKLKQCKLETRREQWLSQSAVKNKCCCEEGINGDHTKPTRERDRSLENLERRRIGNSNGEGENGSVQHESDSESLPSNSPISSSSLLGGTDSGTSFTNSSSSCSSSTSSGGCYSGSITEEEEEGDDGCLDDWEAVADALAADDDKQESEQKNNKENPCLGSTHADEPNSQFGSNGAGSGSESKPEVFLICQSSGVFRLWTGVLVKEGFLGLVAVHFRCHHHVPYAMRIWISRTQVFCPVYVVSGSVFSATRGFLRRMDVVLVAGNHISMIL
ncbi:hypothetical protein PTKIN_Ptkin05aG0161700 [Pterospermum kingtungense]